jgi:ribosomal protein L7/L12
MELLVLLLLPLALLLGLWPMSNLSRQAERQARQLRAIERRIQLIMDHLGASEPAQPMPEVMRHLEAGRKLPAIKAYREVTGVSLKEAKEAVEALEAQLNT